MARRRNRRVDDDGWAFKGSQLQFQLYVNRFCAELNEALRARVDGLNDARIQWRAPLEAEKLVEPRDRAFLEAASLERLTESLEVFWPRGGPVWDGVARLAPPSGASGLLLVEAKSHPQELESSCRAQPASRCRIEKRLRETRRWLDVDERHADAWLGRYYQLANRLAHLHWLCDEGVPTWLVLVVFADDRWHVPTLEAEWEDALGAVGDAMGLDLDSVDGLVHLGLQARERPVLSQDRQAYLRTDVALELGAGWTEAGDAARELGEVLHVLTAWNPGASRPSEEENRAANERLREELLRRPVRLFPAIGTSWSGDHAEESFAVAGLDRAHACGLGRIFGQDAIFEITSEVMGVVSSSEDWEYSRPA